jgi:hypothetical protein
VRGAGGYRSCCSFSLLALLCHELLARATVTDGAARLLSQLVHRPRGTLVDLVVPDGIDCNSGAVVTVVYRRGNARDEQPATPPEMIVLDAPPVGRQVRAGLKSLAAVHGWQRAWLLCLMLGVRVILLSA